ncbi:MAG: hypothetical protein AABZ39_19515 [Spirochaetota bacterium]
MIIPLEKLIEYKGNRYELARAMIELARNGKGLLYNETKVNKGKYISVVIKNVMEGRIKYEYGKEFPSKVDDHAPFMHSNEIYDETKFHVPDPEPVAADASAENADEVIDDVNDSALESEVYESDDEADEDIEALDDAEESEGTEAAAADGDDAKKKPAKKTVKKVAKKPVKKAAPKKAKK